MAQRPVSYTPFFTPFLWFSGHSRALRDTEGHKKSASLLTFAILLGILRAFNPRVKGVLYR